MSKQDALAERLNHPAAHRARQAHRIIRLRETGWSGDRLADLAEVAHIPTAAEHAIGRHSGARGLERLIASVHDGATKDRPGPTDPETDNLCKLERVDLFKVWQENADEACAALDPEGFAAAQESQARDSAERERVDAAMQEAGAWARDEFVPHDGTIPWAANALFDLGREGFLAGEIDFDTAAIKIVFVDSGLYTINLASHKFLSSVASSARVATSAALATKTVTAGVADAADVVQASLSGASIELLLLVQSSAVAGGADVADTAQRLILAIDTATGLPFTPNGGNVTVSWDNGSNRIFKL